MSISTSLLRPAIAALIVSIVSCAPSSGSLHRLAFALDADRGGANVFGDYLSGLRAHHNYAASDALDYLSSAVAADRDNLSLLNALLAAAVTAGDRAGAEDAAMRLEGREGREAGWLADWTLAGKAFRERRYRQAAELWTRNADAPFAVIVHPLFHAWTTFAADGVVDPDIMAAPSSEAPPARRRLHAFHQARFAAAAGQERQAVRAYEKIIGERAGLSLHLALAYGEALERSGDRAGAENFHRELAATGLRTYLPLRERTFEREGDAAGRFAPIDVAPIDVDDEIALIYYDLAHRLERERQSSTALIFLNLALFIVPDHALSQMSLGDINVSRGRYREALRAFEAIEPDSPFHAAVALKRAAALFADGDREAAAETLKTLARRHPLYSVEAYVDLADQQRRQDRHQDAIAAFDLALAAIDEPKAQHWRIHYGRGISHHQLSRWEEAEADFLRALALSPDEPYLLNYLGYSWLEREGNYQRAFEMIERAIEILPGSGFIVDSLGWGHYRLGNYPEAVIHLERAVALEPEEREIVDHLGDAYWRVGRERESRYQWRRALNLLESEENGPADRDALRRRIERKLRFGLESPPTADDRPAS